MPTYNGGTAAPRAAPRGVGNGSGMSAPRGIGSIPPPTTGRLAGAGGQLAGHQIEMDNVPGAVRRPMSFVRALEMSDQLAVAERETLDQRQRQRHLATPDEEHQMYGSSYEISV